MSQPSKDHSFGAFVPILLLLIPFTAATTWRHTKLVFLGDTFDAVAISEKIETVYETSPERDGLGGRPTPVERRFVTLSAPEQGYEETTLKAPWKVGDTVKVLFFEDYPYRIVVGEEDGFFHRVHATGAFGLGALFTALLMLGGVVSQGLSLWKTAKPHFNEIAEEWKGRRRVATFSRQATLVVLICLLSVAWLVMFWWLALKLAHSDAPLFLEGFLVLLVVAITWVPFSESGMFVRRRAKASPAFTTFWQITKDLVFIVVALACVVRVIRLFFSDSWNEAAPFSEALVELGRAIVGL